MYQLLKMKTSIIVKEKKFLFLFFILTIFTFFVMLEGGSVAFTLIIFFNSILMLYIAKNSKMYNIWMSIPIRKRDYIKMHYLFNVLYTLGLSLALVFIGFVAYYSIMISDYILQSIAWSSESTFSLLKPFNIIIGSLTGFCLSFIPILISYLKSKKQK